MKHTQGEWKVQPTGNGLDVVIDGMEVAQYIGGESIREKEANAKLIAAAPEMLEALIQAKKHLIFDFDASDKVLDPIFKAIKKAT